MLTQNFGPDQTPPTFKVYKDDFLYIFLYDYFTGDIYKLRLNLLEIVEFWKDCYYLYHGNKLKKNHEI